MSILTLSPRGLAELCNSGGKIDLADVRTPSEYQSLHAVRTSISSFLWGV
jgi:hypothetical protein